jgi:two-component sensor histidine kinase
MENLQFVLVIKNNGVGFPKDIDFKNTNTLGLQLVNILVEQVDGCLELKNDKDTEFIIWFDNVEA